MIRSRATAALLRLKEIDNKYKVRYDESKNDARSSVDTESLSDDGRREENPRLSSPCEKLEILKPTLNIKIPDTYAEKLDSESSSSNEASPSPRISTVGKIPVVTPRVGTVDKTPVSTPRVGTVDKTSVSTPRVGTVDKTPVVTPRVESTSEIQEALDEGESITEILEESDDIEGIYSDNSNGEKASLASSVENLFARNKESNVDYSNDSFENDTSEAESFTSRHSQKKYSESIGIPQKSGFREDDGISLTNVEDESVGSKNEVVYTPQLSERSRPEETEIEGQTPIYEESQSSQNLDNLSLAELNLKPSEVSAEAEERGTNEDLSSSLKYTHPSHKGSDTSLALLKDSKTVGKSASNNELSTSLEAPNRLRSTSNAKLSKCSSNTDEYEKPEESSASFEAKDAPRSKSNAKPSKRSSVTDGGERHEESSTSYETENTPRSKSNAKPSKRSTVTDGGEKYEQSSKSPKTESKQRSKSNEKLSKRSSVIDEGEKHEESSRSPKTESKQRSKSNEKLSKRSSVIDEGEKDEESFISLEAENTPRPRSNAKPSKRSSITDRGEKHEEPSRSRKTAQSPRGRSEPSPNKRGYSNPSDESRIDVESSKSSESANALFKLYAKKEPTRSLKKSSKISIKGRNRSQDRPHVIENALDVDSFESESSSRGCSSREITERRSASSDEQSEVGPSKIVARTASKSRSNFGVRSSRDPSGIVERKFSDRKKRGPTSASHRPPKSKEKSLKTSQFAPINRGKGEELFEHGNRELERLRARMNDLRLEQERQLMLCYMRDSDEERRRLTMLSNRFYCPGKAEVSFIKPLDLPNVANFVKPDRTGVRCSLLLPDDRLELVRSRLADIRQWLKDQFILYRDYSEVASAINAKYVTDALAAEKVQHSTSIVYFLGSTV